MNSLTDCWHTLRPSGIKLYILLTSPLSINTAIIAELTSQSISHLVPSGGAAPLSLNRMKAGGTLVQPGKKWWGGHRVLPPAGGCHKPASTLADSGRHSNLVGVTGPASGILVFETNVILTSQQT